jgi:hypothetical protein
MSRKIILPQVKDIKESEFAIVCHCSNTRHKQLHYIQNGIIGDPIGKDIKYIDPLCPDDTWDKITKNSLMYIWGVYCPIYTSYSDAKIITKILNNSLEKLKLNGRVLFPVLDEDKNNEYFTTNPFNGFTFSKLHINQLPFIIDKKFPKYTEYYVFTKDNNAKSLKVAKSAKAMTKTGKGVCSRILTPKQVGPICWFMATFVAMFYSQRSRRKILNASSGWNKKNELFTLLKHVLDDNYLKTASRESEDYKKFSDDTFGDILSLLYKENNKAFPYDPKKVSAGFLPIYYIGKLYKLLNVDYKMFHFSMKDNTIAYSYLNEEYDIMSYAILNKMIGVSYNNYELRNLIYKSYKYVENNYAPPILIIKVDDKVRSDIYNNVLQGNKLDEGYMKDELISLREQIFYNGKEYNLDAVVLSNWNKIKTGHTITGITCKKDKYIYNGWTRSSMDPLMTDKNITRKIPCELMKYDWNIIKNNDFCLNTSKCIPELLQRELNVKDICFNFSKGSRILIYVCKDTNTNTSSKTMSPEPIPKKSPKKSKATKVVMTKKKSPKDCPDGKVRNPETGRCILIKNAKTKAMKAVVKKSPKKCEEGKVLNPATGRCILIKNALKALKALKAK